MALTHVEEAHAGISPEQTDALFFAQHFSAYVFARRFAVGRRVLEIGFGDGYGAASLAEVAREVLGVDMSPGNSARAAAKYPRPNLRFQQTDGAALPLADESVDIVGLFQVIEHVPEPELPSFVADIFRVLTPDGVCVLSTLNLPHNMKPGRPYQKLRCHEKEFSADELRALLASVFPSVEIYGLHLTWAHAAWRRLKRWGLDRWGSPSANPVARFFRSVTPRDFRVTRDASARCIDLYAVCRKGPSAQPAPIGPLTP